MWSELRPRNVRIDDIRQRDSTSGYARHIVLRVAANTKKGNSTQMVTATQAKRLEMKWRLSREESLVNLYKRQGTVFTAQASSYVTITADSYHVALKEWAFPKGNYITVELHTTLGTIMVHNAERCQSQRSVALVPGVSSGLTTSTSKSSDRRTRPRERVLHGNLFRLKKWEWRSSSDILQACEVNNGLDEDGVISDVGVLGVKFRERAEEGASAGNVHVTDRSLEGGRGDVWPESIDDVLSVVLIKQHQGDLQTKVSHLMSLGWMTKYDLV